MPEYACPNCGKEFTTPSSAQVRCPHCRQALEAPATPASRWFLARNKKKLGPYTRRQLLALAKRGDVGPGDMLLREGSKQWQRADSVPDLFAIAKSQKTKKPSSRLSTASLVAILAGVAVLVLLSTGLIAGYFLSDRRPVNIEHVNRDNVGADKKHAGGVRPAKSDDGPKKSDAGPKLDDKQKSPEEKTPQPKQAPLVAEQLVEGINRQRKNAGLRQVTADKDLSRACLAHARYLARHLESAKKDEVNVHAEDSKQPGYTIEGERAAGNALIAFVEPTIALEHWMGRLLSRVALLDPELQSRRRRP